MRSNSLVGKGFIGERFDEDAGLQYLNARYYDPELGRFTQPDWFEVTKPGVGTNRYAYSFNDPVNLMDQGGNALLDWFMPQTGSDEANYRSADVQYQRAESRRGDGGWLNTFFDIMGSDDQASEAGHGFMDRVGLSRRERVKMDVLNFLGVAMIALRPNVVVTSRVALPTPTPQVRVNAAKGEAFVARQLPLLKETQTGVVTELTVKTQSGVKTRLDAVGINSHGQIAITEFKSSAKAPFTKNQTQGFPEIETTGATVVGRGKPGFEGGYVIPPTKVRTIKPR